MKARDKYKSVTGTYKGHDAMAVKVSRPPQKPKTPRKSKPRM